MKRTLLLIDAYAMIYRAYYAFINAPRVNAKGENTSAIFGFVITLDELLKLVSPTHIAVAFDPRGGTFRHEAYQQYKAQREQTPEAIRFAVPHIKDILQAMNIPCIEVAGFEADDVIGTLSKRFADADTRVLMATPDKDYGQLVTDHALMFRPRHKGGFETMGPKEVCEKYDIDNTSQVVDLLALMGDSSDNIPGCPGVGEKTAVKLLKQFGSAENVIAHAEEIKGALGQKVKEHTEDITFSKFLATIRTDVPVDVSLDELVFKPEDKMALTAKYQELGFRSLLKKIVGEAPKATRTQVQNQQQLDLFGDFSGKYAAEDKHEASAIVAKPLNQLTQLPQRVAIAVNDKAIAVALSDDDTYVADDMLQLQKILADNIDTLVIAHDIKPILRQITIGNRCFDTRLAHYILQPELAHDISSLASTLLGTDVDESDAFAVARAALSLSHGFEDMLAAGGMTQLMNDIEMPLTAVLARMENNGVRIDVEELQHSSAAMKQRMQQLDDEVQQMAGMPFNISSPKQVGEVLFDKLKLDSKAKKTKTGQYVTSEEVLEPLRYVHPIIDKILDHRALKKLVSTYIDALPQLINPITGKIHTSYNQTVTATGRLSSSNPNLQNIPVRTDLGREIRKAFIPDPECKFLSFDYSQIELRLIAHMSDDPHMISAFNSGEDIHAATAAKIYKIGISDVTADMRRVAKTVNFGIIYGMSAFGLAQRLGISRTEAKQTIDDYFSSYHHIAQYIEDMKQLARRQGYVETMFHRRRYLPDINSRNATVRQFAERNAVNAPIQGSAADIIKKAMIDVDRLLISGKYKSQMILQVHDELNFSAHIEEVEDLKAKVTDIMQNVVKLKVPLIVDSGVGANWLEAH